MAADGTYRAVHAAWTRLSTAVASLGLPPNDAVDQLLRSGVWSDADAKSYYSLQAQWIGFHRRSVDS